ncbi:helix-turn-helix domain-containing protein [Psychrobacter urativorans]|uniref:HTH iclR-type domain-containing protein n=1 Tax=Psychrobacter urativorans TaxID=45610 RepID=A0A0M3V9A5_9GAMM|nr:helix-turn-helix domain-containing protein [Psychrobacter urativorans]ALF60297.1 hypothetical protein AOC03_09830 [Psychrobacter urativorans]
MMNGPIEKIFRIMRLINSSNQPLNPREIADKTDMNIRTVQRLALHLTEEGLIDFGNRSNGYEFMKKGLKV